ncbi:KAP family P-loop NTPase fold protein [Paraburkholderia diazotrophica]|uniref:KAP family P-loop NTPase fold protein n=1 Tax=Paraburkholderia diazotrophica TaxID=667676 RepID=UPI00316E5B1E
MNDRLPIHDAMPSILDREISQNDQDAFGHRHFALALRSMIESDRHQTPFSIGLLGGWGTGKSSIKELYRADLASDAVKQDGRRRSERFHCITFNAWRFGGRDHDIKRALLRHVFLELGGEEDSLQDRLFRQISETTEQPKSWRAVTGETLRAWLIPLPALVIVFAFLFAVLFLAKWLLHLEGPAQTILVACATALSGYVIHHVKPAEVKTNRAQTRIALPSTTSEQYEDMLLEQLGRYKDGQSRMPDGTNGRTCERLIIFVDDLDRLSADEMVLGLDAIRTFMEIPAGKLPKGLGLVFVISCDESRVADALARGRRSGDLPATVFNQSDARRYLDRIFQFRLEIPPPPRNDMREFALSKLKSLTEVTGDLQARGVPLESLVDRMIHVGVQDPRNALQIVNAFAQAWWIAVRREHEGVGSDRPGGLHDGAVTNHPISLGALCAMKVSFPGFYGDLQEDPTFLDAFTDVIVRGRSLDHLPASSRTRLIEKYLVGQDAAGEKIELRSEHRPLRQFIASLGGIRWADPMQSLLLLSEDPITRRLGAKISSIYGAFVSGDTAGVLEAMRRKGDSSALSQEQARTLYQMRDGTRLETEARRNNAAKVIADLIERVPAPSKGQLLGELCRDLDDSIDLRSRVGVQRIVKLLVDATGSDQRAIASRLVVDVLKSEQPVSLQLESMQTPSLDEAVEMARQVVPLALSVRASHGLESDAERRLCDWLLERVIRVSGEKSIQLPYAELEAWLSADRGQIAKLLGIRYLTVLADELERAGSASFDLNAALERVKSIAGALMMAGEESRQTLWGVLTRYIGMSEITIVQVAWMLGVTELHRASDAQASSFIAAWANRLIASGNDVPPIASADVLQPVCTAIGAKLQSLDESALSAVAVLIEHWSATPDSAEAACEVVRIVLPRADVVEERVTSKWASRVLSTLPEPCVRLLASRFESQTGAVQSAMIAAMNVTVSSDRIDDNACHRLALVVESTPEHAWSAGPLQGYLNSLLPQLAARFANPNGYLVAVFPIIAPVLRYASAATFGGQLQQLFNQAKAQPAHYAMLHKAMTGNWTLRADETNPYDPASIFNDACAFVVSYPAATNVDILESLSDMLRRSVVPDGQKPRFIETMCVVWKQAPLQSPHFFREYPELTPVQAHALAVTLDANNSEHLDALAHVWTSVSTGMSASARTETLRLLLSGGSLNSASEADVGLRIWLEVQGDAGAALLSAQLETADLPDEQRSRLWRQAARSALQLHAGFFIDVVPKVIALPNVEKTAGMIFDDVDVISKTLQDADARSKLAHRLMRSFSAASSNAIQGNICRYCENLIGQAALSDFRPAALTRDEFDIIKAAFGQAKDLKRLEKLVAVDA